MNPYYLTGQHIKEEDKVLVLFAGIGLEIPYYKSKNITAVEIYKSYADKIVGANVIVDNVLIFLDNCNEKYDIITCIDGLEHLQKSDGYCIIQDMMRVGNKILLFTPEGFVRNEPHRAWNIEGGDEYQKHLSGWSQKELESLGFKCIHSDNIKSQHGENMIERFYIWERQSL